MTSERDHGASQRVMLLGFGDFERHALASYLRLAGARDPAYQQADSIGEADFVIADADHPGAIDQVLAADRVADTVFIGALAPDGALAWAMRPIDPLQVFREIDAAAALRRPAATAHAALAPSTGSGALDGPARRAGDLSSGPLALVVDDSEIAQRFLQRQLGGLGVRAEIASHSARALQMMSQQRFDIVFLDVELGPASELDGLALCQHLKRQRAPGSGLPPKVVMVSAHTGATDRVRGTLAGCDAYLPKPLDDAALQRQLRQLGVIADAPSRRSLKLGRAEAGPASPGGGKSPSPAAPAA
jgi:two-component system, cell cycle response regulator